MKKFKIIATPPGQAPEWVREEWIGLEFPLSEATPGIQMGALGGKPENLGGCEVDASVALKLLEEKSIVAANWWLSHVPGIENAKLSFKREVCEII